MLRQYSQPNAEPISLAETKGFARIDGSLDDADVARFIATAREHVELVTGRQLVAATWDLYLDRFPPLLRTPGNASCYFHTPEFLGASTLPGSYGGCGGGGRWGIADAAVELTPPLIAIVSITYTAVDGTPQTMDPSTYLADVVSSPARVTPAWGTSWPPTRDQVNAVRIRFVAGYATPFTADADADTITLKGRAPLLNEIFRLANSGGALPGGLLTFTDYYAVGISGNSCGLALTQGGDALDLTTGGTGNNYAGVLPQPLIQAMVLMISHWDKHREAVNVGNIVTEVPMAADMLLASYRIRPFG